MKKFKALMLVTILIVTTLCTSVPVMAAKKKTSAPKVDTTLATPPAFVSSQYALLNPVIAAQCGGDVNKMYQHYMASGVRTGERLYATPLRMPMENLFLYMSYNRQDYLKKGLNANYPYFNLANYMTMNPGLVAQYGANPALYLYHYVNFGVYEGKSSGSLTDPAKVVLWNSGIASLNNAKLSPAKIMNNYTATTGQVSTLILAQPVKQTPAPAPTYTQSKHEHDWKYESIDDDKHWKKCKNCDEKEKEDHHYHVYSQADGTDTSKHVLKCSKCDHKYVQAHYDKNNDGKCDRCDYRIVAPHVHQYGNWNWVSGTTTHKHTCTVSGCTVSETANCDHTTGGTCSGCGHVYAAPAHAHSFGMGTWNSGTTTHTKTCTAAGCTLPPYSFIEDCDHTTGGTCSGCGHVYAAPTHTHTYSSWSDNGNGTHTKSCTAAGCPGGADATLTEDCNHNGAGGKCSECGHEWPVAPHEHTYGGWQTNNNGTHTRACTAPDCPGGDDATQTEDCSYGNDGACTECGYNPGA